MPDLRALTLPQPLADDVVNGRRWLLPRSARHTHTGRTVIHSARRPVVDGLPVGAIVGSVEITGWAPVVAGYQNWWRAWQSGEAFVDRDGDTVRYWLPWERFNPNRPWVEVSDQLDGSEPWAVVFAVPSATEGRCPVCWGDRCVICGGDGVCAPIEGVRGSGGVWRWKG